MINCPKCSKPIGELEKNSLLIAICPNCRFQYKFVRGKLSSKSSKQVTIQRQTKKQIGIYQRQYELRIDRYDNVREVYQFSTNGKDDRFSSKINDVINVICTIRNNEVEEIISFYNESNGEKLVLHQPGSKSASIALVISILIGVPILFIPLPTGYKWWIIIPALLVIIIAYRIIKEKMAPKIPENTKELENANKFNEVLVHKSDLLKRKERITFENTKSIELIQKLDLLMQKIEKVKDPIYESRIETIKKAKNLINSQLNINNTLLEKYGKMLLILEIEQESMGVNDNLQDKMLENVQDKMNEINNLEGQLKSIYNQVIANEEVKNYLAKTNE